MGTKQLYSGVRGVILGIACFVGLAALTTGCGSNGGDHLSVAGPDGVDVVGGDASKEVFDADSLPESGSRKASAFSPNGFSSGQCTWAVDGLTNEDGFKLKFTVSSGRDAHKWNNGIVSNAKKADNPGKGGYLVIEASSGLPYGHVLWVEKISGKDITVQHANWAVGDVVRTVEGAKIRRLKTQWKDGKITINGKQYAATPMKKK